MDNILIIFAWKINSVCSIYVLNSPTGGGKNELLVVVSKNDLKCGFEEFSKLVELTWNTSSNTTATGRYVFVLKRINAFYRPTQNQERLCASSQFTFNLKKEKFVELKQRGRSHDDVYCNLYRRKGEYSFCINISN